MTEGPFHAGELAVQAQAGVRAQARRVGGIVQPAVAPALAAFLAQARLVVAAAADGEGTLWASPLAGPAGFVQAPTPNLVQVSAAMQSDDPLAGVLFGAADRDAVSAGLVALDLATRRRVRINGMATPSADGQGFALRVEQAYVNCPKHIQARRPPTAPPVDASRAEGGARTESTTLGAEQTAWIAAADTFFVATALPGSGAPAGVDASHRGGEPGFVRVLAGDRLAFPDYAGNGMFNTLGNLRADGRIGLVFPDFATGGALHVAGTASVDWSAGRAAEMPGAERVVDVRIARVVQRSHVLPAGWSYLGASPFNPPA